MRSLFSYFTINKASNSFLQLSETEKTKIKDHHEFMIATTKSNLKIYEEHLLKIRYNLKNLETIGYETYDYDNNVRCLVCNIYIPIITPKSDCCNALYCTKHMSGGYCHTC
jgi:hypothetical protein